MYFSPLLPLVCRAKIAPRSWSLAVFFGCSAVFGVAASPVFSQSASSNAGASRGAVTVELQAFKVGRSANGAEQLQSAARAKPGDILEYRATYANVSQKEVKNLQATLPIPVSTEILLNSIAPKSVTASADNRTFAPAPLMRLVKMPDGTTQNRPLPLSAYRALRWPVGTLGAGKNVVVRARVRLNPTLASQ